MSWTLATPSAYLPVFILVLIAVSFGVVNLLLPKVFGNLIGKNRPNDGAVKQMTYEAGMNPVHTARRRFNIRFYILAMTFLVFDVEIVFLYPWATVFPSLDNSSNDGLGALFFFRMLFFVATTLVAYMYAWRKGVFKYD